MCWVSSLVVSVLFMSFSKRSSTSSRHVFSLPRSLANSCRLQTKKIYDLFDRNAQTRVSQQFFNVVKLCLRVVILFQNTSVCSHDFGFPTRGAPRCKVVLLCAWVNGCFSSTHAPKRPTTQAPPSTPILRLFRILSVCKRRAKNTAWDICHCGEPRGVCISKKCPNSCQIVRSQLRTKSKWTRRFDVVWVMLGMK